MKHIKDLIVLGFFVFVYLAFASHFTFKFPTTRFNYFNYLAQAFINGRPNIENVEKATRGAVIKNAALDISVYNNKYYLYWGPVPAILIMPLIKFWGTNFSDIFYTAFIGSLNCWLAYLILKLIRAEKIFRIDKFLFWTLIIFFSFGTTNFSLSIFALVWWTTHIFGLFFLLLAILFILKYKYYGSHAFFYLSSFFYSCAFLTKQNMLLSLFFFMAVIYLKNKKICWLTILKFLLLPTFLGLIYGYYNFIRFGNVFELGFKYQNICDKCILLVKNFGHFNLFYLPRNIYYIFLNPFRLELTFPFIFPDPFLDGNGLFLTTPLFLLLILKFNFLKSAVQKNKILYSSIALSSFFIFLPSLLDYGTGGEQVAPRFIKIVFF